MVSAALITGRAETLRRPFWPQQGVCHITASRCATSCVGDSQCPVATSHLTCDSTLSSKWCFSTGNITGKETFNLVCCELNGWMDGEPAKSIVLQIDTVYNVFFRSTKDFIVIHSWLPAGLTASHPIFHPNLSAFNLLFFWRLIFFTLFMQHFIFWHRPAFQLNSSWNPIWCSFLSLIKRDDLGWLQQQKKRKISLE